MAEVKKAVILVKKTEPELLPISKASPKELWPLGDKPLIHLILQELKDVGIEQVFLVLPSSQKQISLYFKKDISLERRLEKQGDKRALISLKKIQNLQKDISLSIITLEKDLEDGQVLLQIKRKLRKDPFAFLTCDSVLDSEIPCISQLLRVFKTSNRPVLALGSFDKGIKIETEKIAQRFFKVKKIDIKKSDLQIIEKYILTSEIFEYLEKLKKKPLKIINALKNSLEDGKVIYGYEIKGKLFNLNSISNWIELNKHFLKN